MDWYLGVLKKYAVFSGRAHRTEFWFFFLFNSIALIVLLIIARVAGNFGIALYWLYVLATIIPYLAVSFRRLHDTDRSGWWLLLHFIPVIGQIVLLVFFVTDSQPQANEYGPNPKAAVQKGS